MPRLPLPEPIREMLLRPNPAVIATLRKDGRPITVATWYLLEGEQIVVNMDATRRRLQHLGATPGSPSPCWTATTGTATSASSAPSSR